MYVKNPLSINSELIFPCKSNKLKQFLVQEKKLMFIARILDNKDNKYIWMFSRTDELSEALVEWKNNKDSGNLVYSKQEDQQSS
jgi:hypothetical protein